jgi:PTS system nitrogen regulatory IIA component
MQVSEILTADRIVIDPGGLLVPGKAEALKLLAKLLAQAVDVDADTLEQRLLEREALQSTGIGDGVAIPHTSVDSAPRQAAALLLCPSGVEFEAIDGAPAKIIVGVVGPRRSSGEHLRVLARISRLLRDVATREKLMASLSGEEAYDLVRKRDQNGGG